MPTLPAQLWFPVIGQAVDGLGHAELLQSHASPTEFRATLVLNSYESNCLRDWLALRWKAQSMRNTAVVESTSTMLFITLALTACDVTEAEVSFRNWLVCVATERACALQART